MNVYDNNVGTVCIVFLYTYLYLYTPKNPSPFLEKDCGFQSHPRCRILLPEDVPRFLGHNHFANFQAICVDLLTVDSSAFFHLLLFCVAF